jgi:hypothetical protein
MADGIGFWFAGEGFTAADEVAVDTSPILLGAATLALSVGKLADGSFRFSACGVDCAHADVANTLAKRAIRWRLLFMSAPMFWLNRATRLRLLVFETDVDPNVW